MTRDDIARMAREAGDDWDNTLPEDKAFLERFADLVAAVEREACAQSCMETGATKGSSDDALDMADSCAAAIRAMGEK